MRFTHVKRFLPATGAALVVTGLAKVFSATGPSRALDLAGPLLGIPFRHLLLLVGLLELGIAFFCLFTDRLKLSLVAVAWLSINFLVYRLGLWSIGWHKPCGCLCNLTDLLHISPTVADNLMKGLLAFLLFGSYSLLLSLWWHNRLLSTPQLTAAATTPST